MLRAKAAKCRPNALRIVEKLGERNNETSARKRRLHKNWKTAAMGSDTAMGPTGSTPASASRKTRPSWRRERQVAYENRRYGGKS
jgi:hypothetical protein